MISAYELRIGNWVEHNVDLFSVCVIDEKFVYVENNFDIDLYNH